MEINVFVVIYILILHFLADFVFQTDKMAQGKSKNWSDLISHTITYSSTVWMGIGLMCISHILLYKEHYSIWFCPLFAITTFVFHTAQDYITSRVNSKLWSDKKVHLFFVSIGFDQLLHFIQLLLTYKLLQ